MSFEKLDGTIYENILNKKDRLSTKYYNNLIIRMNASKYCN